MKARLLIFSVFGAFIAIIVLIGYLRSGNSYDLQPPQIKNAVPVKSLQIKKSPYVMTESFFGLIEPDSQVEMGFQISGRIAQIGDQFQQNLLSRGDTISKGETLAKLEQDRYIAQLAAAKASIEQSKAALSACDAAIADAEARLADAIIESKRVVKLKKSNAATQREMERSQLAETLAQVAVENAKAKKLEAVAMKESATAAYEVAKVNLQDTTLLAPIDGTIATIPAELGQMVSPQDNIVTLVDISKVKLDIGVVERKLGLLKLGQEVDVYIEALRSDTRRKGNDDGLIKRKGVVATIPPMANNISGLFNIDVDIDNSDGLLRPGMIGRADVKIRTVKAYAIPADAVRKKGSRIIAFVAEADTGAGTVRAKRLEIEPDYIDNANYLIIDLPMDNVTLLTEGNSVLIDGEVVRISDTQSEDPSMNEVTITANEREASNTP
ncbi:Macrolide export protein MacA [Poriferisphaera corsica]|uniref:Macrolide export protein MacA n=1 Tax=Poriferisphaera corsica TaxID=2528020 RepID=A0A517YU25_9BACT|nr:efflux RND transporter periplasmic adaptor subunit [Poriferisphaera corsica]QDU33744.1 Macrolide export protein MacA [Poriferisphaera corsica]